MKAINENKRLLFTLKEKTSGPLVVAPEDLILVEENSVKEEIDISGKLDKNTTAGVERAYIINADGSQGTKATSDFKDVLEFADFDAFPTTGETGKIYVALDKNFTYRWSGSVYVQIGGGTKRIYRFSIPVFQKTSTGSVNEFITQPIFADRFILNTPTGITNHELLKMSVRNVVTEVPFNCVLKRISISNSSNRDGVISIWKTDSDGVSNPVELYYGAIGSGILGNINLTSSNLNQYDKIQFFVARTALTTLWQSGLHLTFEEL